MAMLKTENYSDSLDVLNDAIQTIQSNRVLVENRNPLDPDLGKFLYSCPVFLAYFIKRHSRDNPYNGVKSFEQFGNLSIAMDTTSFFIETVINSSEVSPNGQVEAIAAFYMLSEKTFALLEALAISVDKKVDIERLKIAASSLLIKNHFPKDVVPMPKPVKILGEGLHVDSKTSSMCVKLGDSLKVSHLVCDVIGVSSVTVDLPQTQERMERSILTEVGRTMHRNHGIDPFYL